jgi:hypothetical protein
MFGKFNIKSRSIDRHVMMAGTSARSMACAIPTDIFLPGHKRHVDIATRYHAEMV